MLLSILWAIAFGICPQRPSHSLFLGGQQMPIEARMAGMFGGFLIGAAYFVALGRGRALRLPDRGMTLLLLGFVVPLGADGLNAFFFDLGLPHLYTPYLPVRLATGLLTGLAMAGFIVPTFNSTVWQAGPDVSPLTGMRDVLGGIALEAVYFVAALSGAKVMLYPVSIIAVAGVPVLAGIIGAVVVAMVTGRSNRASRISDVIPLAFGGLLLAAGFLVMMSGARYIIFGAGPLELPPSAFSIAVASNDFGTGAPRVPFILFQGAQRLAVIKSVRVTAYDLHTGTPVPGWSGNAVSYSDYEVPYWVVYPDVPQAGFWGLLGDITLPDGTRAQAQFTIEVTSTVSAPDIGQSPPASLNRTLATEPDLAKLTSDPAPERGLYQLTVADALKSGKPTVVTFATPAFCQSRLCAPVVNSVKAVYHELKDRVNFIHIEVYKTFDPLVYADEMDQWHLISEPWTFVLDRNGKVVARLGGPVSPRELEAALMPLLQP